MSDEEEILADDAMVDLGDDDLDLGGDSELDLDLEDNLLIEEEAGMEFGGRELE